MQDQTVLLFLDDFGLDQSIFKGLLAAAGETLCINITTVALQEFSEDAPPSVISELTIYLIDRRVTTVLKAFLKGKICLLVS